MGQRAVLDPVPSTDTGVVLWRHPARVRSRSSAGVRGQACRPRVTRVLVLHQTLILAQARVGAWAAALALSWPSCIQVAAQGTSADVYLASAVLPLSVCHPSVVPLGCCIERSADVRVAARGNLLACHSRDHPDRSSPQVPGGRVFYKIMRVNDCL